MQISGASAPAHLLAQGGTRLASDIAESEYKLSSNTKWLVLAVVLVLGVAVAVALITLTT
jgi:hypothetical protein